MGGQVRDARAAGVAIASRPGGAAAHPPGAGQLRILPRVLGQAERAVAGAEEVAAVSLSSVTDNPVYLPPDRHFPDGRVLSTGGYHNAAAPATMHQLAAWPISASSANATSSGSYFLSAKHTRTQTRSSDS